MSHEPIGNRKTFEPLPGGGYAFTLIDDAVRVEFRHLRRESRQLFAEVDVLCDWAGTKKNDDGSLSRADLNLSSQTARVGRGKHCAVRANSKLDDFDWPGVIDEGCCRVIEAERTGTEAIVLDDAPEDGPPRDFNVHGLRIPADSHSQLVTDGGGLKSLILLLVLGEMAKREIPVALLDWEWNPARHLARKRRLHGPGRLDCLYYLRCRNALSVEKDHIRRFCEQKGIRFIGIDSISAACDGKLADDDVARAYNRALDDLPPSLAAAHVPKSVVDPGGDMKAFGSAFFHNYARMTWSLRKQIGARDDVVTVSLTPHKQNDGARVRPVGLEFTFTPDRITVRNVDLATVQGLAETLPLWQRMKASLTRGPLTLVRLAEDLGASVETLDRTVRRKNGLFIRVRNSDGGVRIALVDGRVA
jgi:hypothetical protein